MSVEHGADAGFLAVSPQVKLVINPAAGCRYFPPGCDYFLSQSDHPPHGQYQIILLGDRGIQV